MKFQLQPEPDCATSILMRIRQCGKCLVNHMMLMEKRHACEDITSTCCSADAGFKKGQKENPEYKHGLGTFKARNEILQINQVWFYSCKSIYCFN